MNRGLRSFLEGERAEALRLAFLVVLAAALYVPSLANGYVWDDDSYVYNNFTLQRPSALSHIWLSYKMPQYYPVVFTTFLIESKIWGLDPLGYHVVNLLLHLANSVLLYFIVRRLAKPLAFACALVFAIHPVQVETVAWITERKNLLAALFYFLAVICWLRYRDSGRPGSYLASLGSFLLALLSKSATVPFVVLPLILRWWRKEEIRPRHLLELAPFAAAGLAAGANTVLVELHRVGATGEQWTLPFAGHVVLAGRIVVFYLYKLVAPFETIFFYPRWEIDAGNPLQWIPCALVAVALYALYRYRERIGRGGVATLGYFIASLFPALGFFNVYPMMYSWVADHFQYVASPAGILLVVSAVAAALAKRPGGGRSPSPALRSVGVALAILVVSFLGFRTVAHSRDFRDSEALWKSVVERNPGAWMAYNNLGAIYRSQGKLDLAMAAFEKAVKIRPDLAAAHNNIGLVLMDRGNADGAIAAFRKAIEIDPRYSSAYNNVGLALTSLGRHEEAEEEFRKALAIEPRLAPAHFNLGNAYARKRIYDKAIEEYRAAIDLNPRDPEAYNALGVALAAAHRKDAAEAAYAAAIKLDPRFAAARVNLANLYKSLGRNEDALAAYRAASEIDPSSGRLHYGMGDLFLRMGREREAREHLEKARAAGYRLPADAEAFLAGGGGRG